MNSKTININSNLSVITLNESRLKCRLSPQLKAKAVRVHDRARCNK